ncbi:ABC transporter ATP-binding protein [Loktanella salsilacus]|jgi:lipoprotein-releasing system ATP-binding protein|uniref:Lipoprotein-releasing system ATP-binding protein n=1 Tax=Loktanella salsilacus TaxID=195913 RepID=A0A1I4EUI9_9RHOB|nr:ABC transporter ATP-binding protein [Loktanella salsilacus]MBU0780649.1 ABC transporter ATP-binding protein [Alphaproteobacteria bacterium]MBU0861167.1 ABC transporter ATP-binding protein [Alphaproteobacteria bacterium]MBU1835540.1 ABC transporter ATP-binding protein [Alphaproteobacteria bacterium]UTH45191.1 ABC transporter ATP-binding protein [Loktanella salsilacus]SFL07811.1 lipoprotein-releasing system ATP-binding protein [Loktanella salsilacus]
MNNPILTLTDLKKGYNHGKPNEVRVLQGATLSVQAGEVVALVAPSGAGKSTLLHIAGLLDTADTGTVAIRGEDMTNLNDRRRTAIRRNDVGFIYQFHHLLPEFSALENITLPQMANGVRDQDARDRAMMLLETVGVAHRAAHRPAELSGGEQQRVAFCRALANDPVLLLADEPTGNLDPATSDKVFDALMALVRSTGLAAVIATHNLELAARMDRAVRLVDGQLVDGAA